MWISTGRLSPKYFFDKPVKEGKIHLILDLQITGTSIFNNFLGSKVTLCSLKLGANCLYVGVKEGVAIIPNHVSHNKDFRVITMLLYSKKYKRVMWY